MMCGGHSEKKQPDEEERALFLSLKGDVEGKTGKSYSEFDICHFTSQVVAGTIFWICFKTDQGCLHAKVFRPLPHTGNPCEV